MKVVICGGGVIGASTAYFLSRRGVDVTVVERTSVACAASGKSGAFLALDWCRGTLLDALARRSFALHARLPDEIEDDWGYRRLTTYGGFAAAVNNVGRRGNVELDWLSKDVVIAGLLGTTETTAIVHPGAFTDAMMRAAQKQGAELRYGQVTGVVCQAAGTIVEGVEVDDEIITADAVVIAMGPWSILAAQWLPLPGIFADKGHSLIFDTGTQVPADALFLEYQEESGDVLTPEVFPRADGTTYVTITASQSPLPMDPADVVPDPEAIGRLQALCQRLSPALGEDKIIARQACYRPVTQDGLPLIGKVPGIDGAYVATGHNVWGILNAPATGEAMAELIVDGAAHSTDLTPFDLRRLHPFDPAQLRPTPSSQA
jgi:glycine/D-amino acid oxidase-like deaminating enzyme